MLRNTKSLLRYTLAVIHILSLILGFYDDTIFEALNYYTFTGNVMIGAIILFVAFKPSKEYLLLPAVATGLILNIAYVGLLVDDFNIYGDIFESEWQWFTLHYFTHYYLVFDLFYFNESKTFSKRDILKILIVSLGYLAYALVYGMITSDFAYFFLDLSTIGFGVFVYVSAIALAYFVAVYILVKLKKAKLTA